MSGTPPNDSGNALAPQLHFSKEEFAARRAQLLQRMQAEGISGCLIFRQESMYYLTGYDTFGYVFFQCLYLHKDGRMTLLTRSADLRQAQLTSVIDDIRIWEDKHDSNPAETLHDIVRAYGGIKALGVEWDAYGLTAKNGRLVEAAFRDYLLKDMSLLVSKLRVVKSEAELAYVRQAAVLADDALDAAVAETRPGAFEGDILAALQGAIFRGGGEYSGNEFIIGSGARALLCRSYAGRRHLSPVDQLTLEFAGAYRHYHAALMRTLLTGEANARQREMHNVMCEAFEAAKAALQPGEPIGKVFDAHAKVVDDAGMAAHRLNATGYSLGTTFAPNWMDWPMFYRDNPFIAAPGMVFFLHLILMDSENQTAMCGGETLIVTDNGAEGLSRHKHELIVRE